jgi:uncharacterized protein
MHIGEMGKQECCDILARLGFGRLACAHENQPYVVPVYFVYEPERLYGVATMGQKIEWMRLNPLVCLEADEVRNHLEWVSVVVRGRFEELSDKTEHNSKMRQHAQALLQQRSMWWQAAFAAAQTRQKFSRRFPVFYCIHIQEITGHRASPDPIEPSVRPASNHQPPR